MKIKSPTLGKLNSILKTNERKGIYVLSFLLLIGAFFEMASIGILIPGFLFAVDGNHAMYGNSKKMDNPLSSDYNIYELIWTEEFMETKINGISFHKIDINDGSVNEPFHKPFFFILNIAVGGNWPGSPNNEKILLNKLFMPLRVMFILEIKSN